MDDRTVDLSFSYDETVSFEVYNLVIEEDGSTLPLADYTFDYAVGRREAGGWCSDYGWWRGCSPTLVLTQATGVTITDTTSILIDAGTHNLRAGLYRHAMRATSNATGDAVLLFTGQLSISPGVFSY